MDNRQRLFLRIYVGLVTFSIFGTILSRFTGLEPKFIPTVVSVLTLLFGFIIVSYRLRSFSRTIGSLAIGGVTEVVGIYTKFPFGYYRYTSQWQPVILLQGDVYENIYYPLCLPFAWLMIVGAVYLAVPALKPWPKVFLVGGLSAAVDFFMEPVMVYKLHYWEWLEKGPLPGGAPVLNFLGWFLVSSAAAMILPRALHTEHVTRRMGIEGRTVIGFYCLLMLVIWVVK
jgi:uncharacterized membrane protein